jgi:sulfate/thiosulfate transport system ATP-binding protein
MSVIVQNLTKRFTVKDTPAVNDVSFEAPSSAITSLIGPSGAGKSTVLRLIAGLEIAEHGRILLEGDDVSTAPVQARGVGLVFQNYALFQHMTVHDNIAFGLDVRRRPKAEIRDRVAELLRLVQLQDLAQRYPGQLSGGQRQRVAFARALAIRPKVLLLDEPFGALDARVRVELRDWLERLHDEMQLTTILVTHDQQEAFEVSQNVVIMFDGRVVQTGAPTHVYDHPATPATAAFLGANPLRGRVVKGRVEMGSLSVDAPLDAQEGATVHAFVRAHEMKLVRAVDSATKTPLARITRVRPIGGYVKIVVEMPAGDQVTIDLSRADFEVLGVISGDHVQVDVQTANVFVGDYQI